MNEVKLKIFFDESNYGKTATNNKESRGSSSSKLKIDLMGGIAIPNQVYSAKGFDHFNQLLKQDRFSIHWTDYNGDSNHRTRIYTLMKYISKYQKLLDVNIIYKEHSNTTAHVTNEDIADMMYYKFPERIIYGLLRGYNLHTKIITDIYIEDANEYKREEIDLKHNTVKNLKKQAIYRGQTFDISSDRFHYVDCRSNFSNVESKEKVKILNKREIGVYAIDIIIGMVRTILENHYYTDSPNELSRGAKSKNELVMQLLVLDDFYKLIKNINLFYWNYEENLERLDMEEYLKTFLSNQKLWIDYIDSDGETDLYI